MEKRVMSLQFLEEELNKLIAINERFHKWEVEFNEKFYNKRVMSLTLFEIFKRTPFNWDTFLVVTAISNFTANDNVEVFESILKELIKKRVIKNFERKDLGYFITAKDETPIRFIELTDFFQPLDEDVKNRLKSTKRYGHCHWDSIHIVENLVNPSNIVSGYITLQSKKMKFSHSWVEMEYLGKVWVLDFTMNVMMNKEGYYKLYNPQNIIKIGKNTLIEDLKLMEKTTFKDKDIRMYLFNPEEARNVMLNEFKNDKTYEIG